MRRFNIMVAKKYPKSDGTTGTKWVKLGSVVQQQDGKMFGDLDSVPIGAWFDGSIQLFEADQQQQSNNSQQGQYNQSQQGYNQQQPYQYPSQG